MTLRVVAASTTRAPGLAARIALVLINFLGLWLCAGVVALLRGPWHTPAMLLNTLAAVAFVLALWAAVRRGVPNRLLTIAGIANLLTLAGVVLLAAWELADATPWQSAAGFTLMASVIPTINAISWGLARSANRLQADVTSTFSAN